jgi:hypothetical protein
MSHAGPSRTTLLVPAVVCLAIGVAMALQLSRSLQQDSYWTPAEAAPSLEASADRIEVLLDGVPLDRLLADGELLRADGSVPGADDVTVRFNDSEQISARHVVLLTVATTAGIVLLLLAFVIPGRRSTGVRP